MLENATMKLRYDTVDDAVAERWLQGVSSTADATYEGTIETEWVLHQASSIVPIFTGGLSVFGAFVILRELVVDHQTKRGNSISRMLMSLSVANMMFSSGIMMSTFASPAGLDYIWGNVGNTQTCELQGFLLILGHIASPMFTTALAYFYVLLIRYGYPDQALQKIEVLVHTVLWIIALTIAVAPLYLDMYNNKFETCWIAESPGGCSINSNVKCERGNGASNYAHVLAFIPLWPCIFVSTFIAFILYSTTIRDVEEQGTGNYDGKSTSAIAAARKNQAETTSLRDENPAQSAIDRNLSRAVAIQVVFYVLAFLLTYATNLVVHILGIFDYHNQALYFTAKVICMPLQGMLIYLHVYIF